VRPKLSQCAESPFQVCGKLILPSRPRFPRILCNIFVERGERGIALRQNGLPVKVAGCKRIRKHVAKHVALHFRRLQFIRWQRLQTINASVSEFGDAPRKQNLRIIGIVGCIPATAPKRHQLAAAFFRDRTY
jgi:hypothetical protein